MEAVLKHFGTTKIMTADMLFLRQLLERYTAIVTGDFRWTAKYLPSFLLPSD